MLLQKVPADSAFAGNAKSLSSDGLRFFEECERLGPIVLGRAYHKRFYVVTGPDLIEEVLVKKAKAFAKPRLLRDLKMIFGDSLLTADGDLWRHRRRLVQPVFHAKNNAAHGAVMVRGIAQMLSGWRSERRDVHPDLVDVCITNLTRSFLGVSDPELTARVRDLASVCHEVVQALGEYRSPWFVMFPSLLAGRFQSRLRELEADIVKLATERRKTSAAAPDDFLQRVVHGRDADGCPMSARAIRDETVTMLLAGHETAAAAVSWGLYLLATHPEARRRLVDELDAVCGERAPTFEDLPRLPWLDKVLLETYRLYPPTHRIGRTVNAPVSLGGVDLEIGTDLLIPQWAVHRSPRWFDDPKAFRPERWTDDFVDRLHRFAFFPFSAGPRVCIGQALVTIEDALLLGSIAKAFDFELVAGARIEPVEGLTLLPGAHGTMPLNLRRRAPTSERHHAFDETPAPLSSSRVLPATPDSDDGCPFGH
jgi:cytochrome P450